MVLNKRIRRVFLANKAQYIGSIVLIILSTYAFTAMNLFAANFQRLLDEFETDYVQEDASFTTENPISDISALELAGSAIIQEERTLDYELGNNQTLRLSSYTDKINIPSITEGTDLTTTGEILLGQYFASVNDYAIGDEIQLGNRSFTIVGFMTRPNFLYPVESASDLLPNQNFGTAVISHEDFPADEDVDIIYSVKFNNLADNEIARAIQFRELLSENGIAVRQWTDVENNRRVSLARAEVQILNLVSKAIPTGILLLATVMVANVIWRMIKSESRIIGALYALGYKRREIYQHYMIFPLLIALIGGVIGTLIGASLVKFLVAFMVTVFIIPQTGIELNPLLMLISPLLPVVVLGMTGFLVIRSELKHSPIELMRGKEDENKVSYLERGINLDSLAFSIRFALKQQLRSISRVLFLLIGVTVATILLLWSFFLKSSTDFLVTGVRDVYDFEYEYTFPELRYAPLPEGAEPFSAELFLPSANTNQDFHVTGVESDTIMLTLTDRSGNALAVNQVILTLPLAEEMGVNEGDTVNIIRRIDGRTFTLSVDAIADTYGGNFIFMPLEQYNATFDKPAGSYQGSFSNVEIAFPENEAYNVVTLDEKIEGVQELIAIVIPLVVFIALIASAVAVLVIYVVTTLVVDENKDTIALMKVFGYRRKEINNLILNSSTIIVLMGYLIGIPLTNAAVGTLSQTMKNAVGLALPPSNLGLPYVLIGFVLIMLVYQFSKWLCRKKVDNVSMSDALKLAIE